MTVAPAMQAEEAGRSAEVQAPSRRFLSIPYLLLRSSTAGGALLTGLTQTFVFARVLSPEQFSIFILIGTLGVTLWLVDLGMSKIVFVRMRDWFLSGDAGNSSIPRQAAGVASFYGLLALVVSLICTVVAYAWPGSTALDAAEIGLFFLFTAFNLVWFVFRNVSLAVDDYVAFESLEAARRVGHLLMLLAMLAGLPLLAFVLLANAYWIALFVLAGRRLAARHALAIDRRAPFAPFATFFQANRSEVARTGTYALNEFYLYNFPYLMVPMAFGLGAPTIVLDTTFKIFRGATVLYSAGCDVALPRQTRAFAERDRRSLVLATLMAVALCAVPAAILLVLLFAGAERFFSLLLGPAAVMPAQTYGLLAILLVANLAQTVANFVLFNTGYFREIARLASIVSVLTTLAALASLAVGADLVGFLKAYTAVYVFSSAMYVALAVAGPIRDSATARLSAPS